jgi:hypothetical protein
MYGGAVPPAYAAWVHRQRRRSEWGLALLLLLLLPVVCVADLVLIVALTVAGVPTGGVIIAALVTLTLTLGAITLMVVGRNRRAALRRGGAAGTAPLPARPAAPPRPDRVWHHAQRRFHALRAAYAAYECDPMRVLRLPALSDVRVDSTARFVDAFAQAQALETDRFPGETHAAQFVAAVDRAERSWRAACDAAERIRHSGLSPAERATVERVIKLLTTARDSDCDAERVSAYAKARSELLKLDKACVIHVPLPARSALDEAARGVLPAPHPPAS